MSVIHLILNCQSGGGWNPQHFTSRQSHIKGGVGTLHTAHVTSTLNYQWVEEWYPQHFTSSENHIVGEWAGILDISHLKSHQWGGWVDGILHISHSVKVTSSGGGGISTSHQPS